jgi:hypothetical protein
MRFTAAIVSFCSFLLMSGCGPGNDDPSSNTGPQSSYPAHAAPTTPPPYLCIAPGSGTQTLMQRLNAFWQSQVIACACDSWALAQGCAGNAFGGNGYIYYDREFLNAIDLQSGSALAGDFFMAHEFAHSIQTALGVRLPGKLKELQADCLGGYYVGHQIHQGQVTQPALVSAFNFACSIGDPFVSGWWDSTHGVCPERVTALQRGISGYFSNIPPLNACS